MHVVLTIHVEFGDDCRFVLRGVPSLGLIFYGSASLNLFGAGLNYFVTHGTTSSFTGIGLPRTSGRAGQRTPRSTSSTRSKWMTLMSTPAVASLSPIATSPVDSPMVRSASSTLIPWPTLALSFPNPGIFWVHFHGPCPVLL